MKDEIKEGSVYLWPATDSCHGGKCHMTGGGDEREDGDDMRDSCPLVHVLMKVCPLSRCMMSPNDLQGETDNQVSTSAHVGYKRPV